MLELLQFDENLFHLVNTGCQNAFFDWLMPLLRSKLAWLPVYVFIASFLLINYRRKGLFVVLALVLTVAVTDNTSSRLIKKQVQRLRPCAVFEPKTEMQLRVACGSGYSFPSSHAANHFAMAAFLSLSFGAAFRWTKPLFFLWAGLVAFAQVYVGVHYPLDVVAGALLGLLLGWLVFFAMCSLLGNLEIDSQPTV